jgi:hypothetical protein
MENQEVLQPGTNEEVPAAAPSTETVQPGPELTPGEFDGLAVMDFTAEELHLLISALVNMGRDIQEGFVHHALRARAEKYFDLALRLDEEYAEYFLAED